jgi:Glycosyltransferase 61
LKTRRTYRRRLPALIRRVLYPDAIPWSELSRHGVEVSEDVRFPSREIHSPDAPLLGMWPEASFAATPRYRLPEIFAGRLRGVLYNPWCNLVTTQSGATLIDSTSTVLPIDWRAWTGRLRRRIEPVSGLCTVFRSVHNNFYHTLIDNLSRVFLLRQPCYQDMGTIKMLFPTPPTSLERYYLDRYLPSNVQIFNIADDVCAAPEELLFPSFFTRRTVTYLPRTYLDDFLPHVLPDRPREKRHRIFVSRRVGERGALRLIENEAELWARLSDLGFCRYFLEDLSISEQIDLFYDAEVVVAAHGAGLANLIFSKEIDIIELHAGQMVIPTYYYLSLSLEHRYKWWKGAGGHFEDNFEVDVEAVVSLLPEPSGALRKPVIAVGA